MDAITDLIDRYIAMWNETDAERRRALIASVWTAMPDYLDPRLQAKGRVAIDAMVAGVHRDLPGHRFRRTSAVDRHHDRVRFAWELVPEGGPPLVAGIDVGVVAGWRLQSVTGFFDPAPAGA